MFVGNLFRKLTVIDLVVIPADALFWHAGRAARFKDIEGPALERFRTQTSGWRSRNHSS